MCWIILLFLKSVLTDPFYLLPKVVGVDEADIVKSDGGESVCV